MNTFFFLHFPPVCALGRSIGSTITNTANAYQEQTGLFSPFFSFLFSSFLSIFTLGRLPLLFRREALLLLCIYSPQRRFTGYQGQVAKGNTASTISQVFLFNAFPAFERLAQGRGICRGGGQILRKGRQMDMT